MASRSPASIRNVAICGHSTCGKTTLVESLLYKGGAISRKGAIADGTTSSDYDQLEKHHKHSIDLTPVFLDYKGATLQLLDTPGYRDFIGQVYSAVPVVENALLLVDGDEGVRPHTRKIWQIIESQGIPCMIVISRMDRDHAKPDDTLAQLREQLSPRCVPIQAPLGKGAAFTGVEWAVGSSKGSSAAAAAAAQQLLDAVVETNDGLMERYLGGETIPDAEIESQLRAAYGSRSVFPVVYASGEKDVGVSEILDLLVNVGTPATDTLGRKVYPSGHPEQATELKSGAQDPLCAFVFKVVSDPYVGKLSFARIFSGTFDAKGAFLHPHTHKQEKVGKLVRMRGKDQEPVEHAVAGEIIALLKVEGLKAFDTISTDKPLSIDPPRLPSPMYSRAVEPKSKNDEKKFAEGIVKIIDEDVMVKSIRDNRTHEMVVTGVSQLHLNTLWERLKTRYHVEINTKEPKTPYLETVTALGDDHFRHKKQTGGAGEFAEVWLRVRPLERGKGIEFENKVFGGAISQAYASSAEKGCRAVMERGVIAGYPVVDVRVEIYDGKEHPVDSKDVAFQKAGREAFKLAVKQAKPILLEPVVHLEVTFPVEKMGDIQGDLNRRRARVTGADSVGNFQTLKALVPLAEIADYASSLGSMTGGQGSYAVEMSHYDPVPSHLQQKICDAAKAEMEKDHD